MNMITTILVPIDFSAASMHALDYAVELGRSTRAKLIVVSALDVIPFSSPFGVGAGTPDLATLLGEQRQLCDDQLAKVAKELKKRRIDCRTVLLDGVPSEQIVAAAKKLKADLIVMSTHGRSGLSHMLLGSVAEKVVRMASCPVLTVRASKGGSRLKKPARKATKRG